MSLMSLLLEGQDFFGGEVEAFGGFEGFKFWFFEAFVKAFLVLPGDARGIATPRCHCGGAPRSKFSCCRCCGRERMIEMCKCAVNAG